MSEFVVNEDMFGKYCKIPTGCSRAEHIYKIVKRIESNTYCDVPLYSGRTEEITHKDTVPVLLVIHCGVYESEVIRVPLAACKICGVPDGWISVKDSTPKSTENVIVYDTNEGILIGFFVPHLAHWFVTGPFLGVIKEPKVSHWRELPEPPRIEERNNED